MIYVSDYSLLTLQAAEAYAITTITMIVLIFSGLGGQATRFILFFPTLLSVYFFIGTVVFEFGLDIPVYDFLRFNFDGYLWTLSHFSIVFLGILAGVLVSRALIPARHNPAGFGRQYSSSPKSPSLMLDRLNRNSAQSLMMVIAAAPAILVLLSADLTELWSRTTYPPIYTNERLMSFADTVFWVSVFCTALLNRPACRGFFLSAIVLSFAAIGARQAFVAIILYIILRALVLKSMKLTEVVIYSVLAVWVLACLMQARIEWNGGLLVIGELLLAPRVETLSALSYSLNYMTIFSIVVNTQGTFYFQVNPDTFLYGISPLPSFFHNQTDSFLAHSQLQSRVPLPGFAFALQIFGVWLFAAVLFLYALALGLIQRALWRPQIIEKIMFYIALLLPLLFSLQYNIRGSSRLLYLFFLLYILLGVGFRYSLRFRQ
ncbi:hypothetical protein [Pseudotabrizicola sp. 4114]|uniref:hypothetical protein n=1 Tax=Pseudotabrizicola sp. 4114 TaxID=2817731 RepID=UPI0028606E29|nr:hypothetical protein [Pseudorhodobacter sp. 4114]